MCLPMVPIDWVTHGTIWQRIRKPITLQEPVQKTKHTNENTHVSATPVKDSVEMFRSHWGYVKCLNYNFQKVQEPSSSAFLFSAI